MLPACLPVHEMWDHIFDDLCRSQYGCDKEKDLGACSLVCRGFVASAQSRLFRDIRPESFRDYGVDDSAGNRLANLLTTSPHLIRYTRILDLPKCDKEALLSVNRIPWSHLKTLTLGRFVIEREVPPSLRELHKLVRLPTLRHLGIRGDWKTEHLRSISTSSLERLDIVHCALKTIPSRPLPAKFQKIRIRQLSLLDSESAGELLADPACPVDLSGLTHLYIRIEPLRPALAAALLRSCSTIHTLHYAAYADRQPLDLSRFTALRSLHLGELYALPHMYPCTAALTRLRPDNAVTEISLTVFGRGYLEHWMDVDELARDLRDWHAALVEVQTPALQRVEISVDSSRARDSLGLGTASMAKLVRDMMPLLHARGILDIVRLESEVVQDEEEDLGGVE
ncbi:hypothetical protein DFH06DRAFT_391879 [Mycena polygramma]|nr:hypothetical protein DFH06DRAFT_391879 [Mycena polygramma]